MIKEGIKVAVRLLVEESLLQVMGKSWNTVSSESVSVKRSVLYYASLLGLDQPLHDLINSVQLEGTMIPALLPASTSSTSKTINAQGEVYGNALQAASYRGHEKVV